MSAALSCEYHRTAYPADFSRLLGIGEESYCRYLWSPRIKEKAWQATGTRQSGKSVVSIKDFKLKAEAYVPALDSKRCSVDLFISPNQFFDWRNTKQLASLHANWLEIDTKGHAVLSEAEEQTIIAEVFAQIAQAGLPEPTGYILSGTGGIHLYWIYAGVEAYKWRVDIWRNITTKLGKALTGGDLWHVDWGASRDPARVMRMIGTYHGKTGRLTQGYVGGPFYSFANLAQLLNVPYKQPVQAAASSTVAVLPKKKPLVVVNPGDQNKVSGRHTIGQWWAKIYFHTLNHLRKTGVPEGKRDSAAFILYVALRHMKPSEEDAFKAILTLNDELIKLPQDQLIKYLSTARKTHYKYRKDSVADYLERLLGIDSRFLFENDKAPLTPEEVKQSQSVAAQTTAQTRRTQTLSQLMQAAKQLVEAGLNATQTAVAGLAGKSVRTVKRYWSEITQEKGVIRSASIYSPP
ncbi:hypothetical protein [Spartinivicinus ruber]|uniref:hypothetical protein n=1 Tax=Spartinivicinus ruber TaxID=2683272 RepID=UPI0013D283CE|nr:hypothetical protein [Spartinivicinus ruber]